MSQRRGIACADGEDVPRGHHPDQVVLVDDREVATTSFTMRLAASEMEAPGSTVTGLAVHHLVHPSREGVKALGDGAD